MADVLQVPVRMEVRFKNARLYNAISAEAARLARTPAERRQVDHGRGVLPWCRANGFRHDYTLVLALLNLQASPWRRFANGDADYRPLCRRIAAALELPVADLFPGTLYRAAWRTLVTDVPIATLIGMLHGPAPRRLIPPAQEDVTLAREARDAIARVLRTLTPREARVLRLRFGLERNEEHTLSEVAARERVGIERIRQIEAKALRKLRHPDRARHLRDLLPGE